MRCLRLWWSRTLGVGRWLRPDEAGAVVINQVVRATALPHVRSGDSIQLSIGGHPTRWQVVILIFLGLSIAMGVVGFVGLAPTMSTNVIERTREFAVVRAIGARAATVRRIVVAEGVFIALVSFAVAVIPATLLTVAMGTRFGRQFLNGTLPFQVSIAAVVIWIVAVILGAVLATSAPASRASRLTVREALTYL